MVSRCALASSRAAIANLIDGLYLPLRVADDGAVGVMVWDQSAGSGEVGWWRWRRGLVVWFWRRWLDVVKMFTTHAHHEGCLR
jgi:hypothetical protein